jgi:hypothetical protein
VEVGNWRSASVTGFAVMKESTQVNRMDSRMVVMQGINQIQGTRKKERKQKTQVTGIQEVS